jgi:hypothetical protein
MNIIKFEWITSEDSIIKALEFNRRMLEFFSILKIEIIQLETNIEIHSLGYEEDSVVYQNTYDSLGCIYIDQKDQLELEEQITLHYLTLNPRSPMVIDILFNWGIINEI